MNFSKHKVWWIILGSLAIILITIFVLRILTPEDTWICADGGWQKHGNPTDSMPRESCK